MGTRSIGVDDLLRLADACLLGQQRPHDGAPVVVVDLDGDSPVELSPIASLDLATAPLVIVGVGAAGRPEAVDLVDVVVPSIDEAEPLLGAVARRPLAATALALLLRDAGTRWVGAGLVAESATYSMLQAGPEFAAWRAAARPRRASTVPADVTVTVTGDTVDVVIERDRRHNALDAATLQRLLDALSALIPMLASEPTVRVSLRGAGASFSSGGDLAEFGSFADPVDAHVVRLARSIGRHLAAMADRVTAHLHGWCLGAGIELPAFVHDVAAEPSTTRIALPELALGLIPGAGGTVSLTGRIGRHRTMLLALTGEQLDAATAHEWGLVDRLEPVSSA